MEKLVEWLREATGIKADVVIRDFEIRRSCSPLCAEPLYVSVELQIVPPEILRAQKEVAGVRVSHAGEDLKAGTMVKVVDHNKKTEAPPMKRKYSRRKKVEVVIQKPVEKKDLLNPGRIFSTSDEDIKVAKAFLCSWAREHGMLSEDQKRALASTAGIFAKSMSEPMKAQILSIFNDVRKKKGLVK